MLIAFFVVLCCAWGFFKFRWLYLPADYRRPRVLMYHMVCDHLAHRYYTDGQKVKNYLRVTPVEFEKQVAWLKNNNFTFLKATDLISGAVPEKSVVITFDDGYEDNYRCALPILKKYGAVASIYLVNNRFHQDWASDRKTEKVAVELNDQPMLSHEQIEKLLESGLIEIGAHTLNHVRLNTLSDDEQWNEITLSRKQIETLYNVPCDTFVYPFGYFDKESVKMVEKAGYSCAFTTEDGTDDYPAENPYLLKRIMVSGNDSFLKFVAKIRRGGR